MKFSKTKLAVAAILALSFSSAQAAFINDNNIVISIVNNDIDGKSMLIDTNILAQDVIQGNVTTFTSNTDLTAAISNFITGGTKVMFWAGGRWKDGAIDTHTLSTTPILDTKNEIDAFADSNLPAFISNANIDVFATATVGLTESWAVDIPAGNPAHYINPNTNGFVGSVQLGVDGAFNHGNSSFFGGVVNADLAAWRLDTDGTLTYNVPVSAVPVPAAVWLFGSGLLGLVGVARRKA